MLGTLNMDKEQNIQFASYKFFLTAGEPGVFYYPVVLVLNWRLISEKLTPEKDQTYLNSVLLHSDPKLFRRISCEINLPPQFHFCKLVNLLQRTITLSDKILECSGGFETFSPWQCRVPQKYWTRPNQTSGHWTHSWLHDLTVGLESKGFKFSISKYLSQHISLQTIYEKPCAMGPMGRN